MKERVAVHELSGTQRLSRRVAGLKPSGIRKFFDIAATMHDVISLALKDPAEYPDHSTPGYAALRGLYERVRRLCAEAFDEPYTPSGFLEVL